MVARIWCLALALGVLAGCYDLPQPECGFACGPAGACPSDYSCNMAVNRCELSGTTPTCDPAPRSDAGMDARPDTPDDLTPPTVTAMFPAASASDVPTTTPITATFSEPVLNVSSATIIVDRGGTQISGTVSYDPSSFTATFQPASPLFQGTTYTVSVLDTITDTAGNPMALSQAWAFQTVADTTPPTIMGRSPAVDAINVGVGANIFVDFTEQVFGVSASSFTVTEGATPVAGVVSYSFGPPSRATLTQSTQLAANTTYTVSVGSPIADTAFNALAPVSWMFTTGPDLQAPIVVTRTPQPASAAVPVTAQVTASFDEPVVNLSPASFTLTPQGGSPVAATVSYTAGTRTATLTPDLQLAPNTLHTATLTSAITDAATNPLAQVAWTFTTAP